MIRADSTLADARYRLVFPQGKQTDSPANRTPWTLRGGDVRRGNRRTVGAIGPEDTRR